MSSGCKRGVPAAALVALMLAMVTLGPQFPLAATTPSLHAFRVCADPNNLPFSNARSEGFENRIASLMARRLGQPLEYYWQPQRRGFVRSTLREGACDVIMGGLTSSAGVLTTRPYYRSAYAFVSLQRQHLHVRSFDDPRLSTWRIGIQLTGNDYGNPPPAYALASRHILQNVHGYTVYGDYSQPNPQARIVDAVRDGSVDVAVVWGPVAGYFARQPGPPLDVVVVSPLSDGPSVPLAFDISMAVRQADRGLVAELNRLIASEGVSIRHILDEYHVPVLREKVGAS